MSQLIVSAASQDPFYMNVLSMSSPVFGEMNSAQTKSMVQWFPIKAMQPEIQFNVIFPTENEWEDWQVYCRTNMINAQSSNTVAGNAGVTLNWPQRSIQEWSGLITKVNAGGRRFNVAPRASFIVQLINSLVSNSTTFGSFGITNMWQALTGANANTDSLLALPELVNQGLNNGTLNPQGGTVAGNTSVLNGTSNAIAGLIPGVGGFS
jgi:hypothetical protein